MEKLKVEMMQRKELKKFNIHLPITRNFQGMETSRKYVLLGAGETRKIQLCRSLSSQSDLNY